LVPRSALEKQGNDQNVCRRRNHSDGQSPVAVYEPPVQITNESDSAIGPIQGRGKTEIRMDRASTSLNDGARTRANKASIEIEDLRQKDQYKSGRSKPEARNVQNG
jgi:hypothetical protein